MSSTTPTNATDSEPVDGEEWFPFVRWEQRVAELRAELVADGLPHDAIAEGLRGALVGIQLRDPDGRAWMHDGTAWRWWSGAVWDASTPAGQLRIDDVVFEDIDIVLPEHLVAVVPSEEELRAMSSFVPTHIVPSDGIATWPSPGSAEVGPSLDELLPVRVMAREGAWAQVVCENGWSAWVDGRLLPPEDDLSLIVDPGTPNPG